MTSTYGTSLLDRIVAIRTGGATERCHGITHHGSYSVAAHTWGVLCLLFVLWPEDFARLAPRVMFHDVPEGWIGDVPAPTKRFSPAVKEAIDSMETRVFEILGLPHDSHGLSAEDLAKTKACDHLELYLWAAEQICGGNRHASCIMRELESYFDGPTPLPPTAHDLYMRIRRGRVEHRTDGLIREIMA